MSLASLLLRLARPGLVTAALSAAGLLFTAGTATAAPALTQLSTDPYTNTTSQHATEVEPDTFAYGSTIVSAFQVGRFTDGGGSNVGFATSTDSGATWTNGFLPGITTQAGGSYARVSDASVAYDAKHNVWLVSAIPITASVTVPAVFTSRSTDGGHTWGNPVTTATGSSLDKNWIVCDNTATSAFYGNCYTEYDNNGNGDRIQMTTSSDGGLTWGAPKTTANNATGLGGQPVVQPNGTVVVPIASASETSIRAFTSTNGGSSWTSATTVTTVSTYTVHGSLRSGPLPSAEIDAAGKVYVVWQDCRFRTSGGACTSNDIVMSTSTNGTTWSTVVRIPIDATTSTVDHFIPGLAVDPTTSGSTAHLALAYYYHPVANCTAATCQLDVGYLSSTNGGSTWSTPTQLAGPMSHSWLASTTQGTMVGDYISTSFSAGTAHPVFAVATAPTGSVFHEAMYTPATGLTAAAGTAAAVPATTRQNLASARLAAIAYAQWLAAGGTSGGGEDSP
ncbi:sialidase family protein [Streptacidiphilus sp. N1-10]|uniref:Sialidase family protein n=1 Tax=Streptacidiphilus jeojiensis TaxID=3229225 RepID=A0ABV6XFG6_9ACTN